MRALRRAGRADTRARADVAIRRARFMLRVAPSIVIGKVTNVMHMDTHVSTIVFLHAVLSGEASPQ